MKLIWNFIVLAILMFALMFILNEVNKYFGLPELMNFKYVDDVMRAIFGAVTNK